MSKQLLPLLLDYCYHLSCHTNGSSSRCRHRHSIVSTFEIVWARNEERNKKNTGGNRYKNECDSGIYKRRTSNSFSFFCFFFCILFNIEWKHENPIWAGAWSERKWKTKFERKMRDLNFTRIAAIANNVSLSSHSTYIIVSIRRKMLTTVDGSRMRLACRTNSILWFRLNFICKLLKNKVSN